MNRKHVGAILGVLVLLMVVAISGCTEQTTPTVAKKQLNVTEYEALVQSVASTMDIAEDTVINTHDDYMAGYYTDSEAIALFREAESSMADQEARMKAITPPAGYETLNGYIISAIENEKACAQNCIKWVETGDPQYEQDGENQLARAQEDLDKAMAEMKRLGY